MLRRHSLDPESIRKQILSVFTTSSRKRQNLANNSKNSTSNHGLFNVGRRLRRFSVPDRKDLNMSDDNFELHTIDEVSKTCIAW